MWQCQWVGIRWAKTQDVGARNGRMLSAHDVANNTTYSGVGPTEGFNRTWVIMCFAFQRQGAARRETDDSSVANKRAHHIGSRNCFGAFAQLIDQRWASDSAICGDDCTKRLVSAVLAPCLRDGFKFHIGGVDTPLSKVFANGDHLFRVECEATLFIDSGELFWGRVCINWYAVHVDDWGCLGVDEEWLNG